MTPRKIGFAGMTHLGLNSALASAARGFQISCFDPNPERIRLLNAGQPEIVEPNLVEYMHTYKSLMTYSDSVEDLKTCQFVYIAPDVPTDERGSSDLTSLCALIEQVDQTLPSHVAMVLLSQVPPGFSRKTVIKAGRELYYQVETLIFGQAIERALNPERFIIGCKNPDEKLNPFYTKYLEAFACPILPMRYESAELTKISINCCLVASISVANTISEICEKTGADWSEMVKALKLDRRIGAHAYLSPGLGIAGGNLERDLNTIIGLSQQYGTEAGVVKAWIKNSQYRKNWALRTLNRYVLPKYTNPQIAIWGLAYKQDTHSTKNSPSLELISGLGDIKIKAFDPVVRTQSTPFASLSQANDALDACEGSDVLAIMTPWPEFRKIHPDEISRCLKGNLIIDPYRILDGIACKHFGLEYYTLGA